MLTDTAEKFEEAPVIDAGAPVVLADVTKRYGRRRNALLAGAFAAGPALDRVSLSFAAGSSCPAASRRLPPGEPG
jgi:hypothetical protein